MKEYLEIIVKLIAVSFIITAQMVYLYRLSKKSEKFKPTIVTWLGWAILMGVSFLSQFLYEGWTIKNITLLLSTVGCILIVICAKVIYNHFKSPKKADWYFFSFGIACIILYLLFFFGEWLEESTITWLTISIAIFADFLFAIPMIKATYEEPDEEKVISWPLALIAWTFTLLMLQFDFSWAYALWPIYLILFNGTMTYLTYIRTKRNTNHK